MNNNLKHRDMLRQLLENMPDNIFFKDRDSKFIMLNEADARYLGANGAGDIIGKDDFDLFPEEFARATREDEQRLMDTGEPLSGKEEQIAWKDGHVSWISTTKIPLRNADHEIVGCIGIGRDITEIKEKEAELEQVARQLRASNTKLRMANELIAEDFRLAAELQKTFLPDSYPDFTGPNGNSLLSLNHFYQASTEMGGDYCTIFKLDEKRVGLLICDVMGHGVRAALVTAMIRATADEIARETPSPGAFFNHLNEHLYPALRTSDDMVFATACYLVLDTTTGEISGSLAAHPVPIIAEAKTQRTRPLDVGDCAGPALAIAEKYDYQNFSAQMAPGDTLLLYTDGVTEEQNEVGQEFGPERLERVLKLQMGRSLEMLLPGIVQEVRAFSKEDGHLEDDVCLLGARLMG